MPAKLILSVQDALVRYPDRLIFEDLTFHIHEGKRIALVGKNGAGKSTLMDVITGKHVIHDGERWEDPNLTIGYLRQDVQAEPNTTVFDYIFEEIAEKDRELYGYKVDIVTDALQLDPQAQMTRLSGGQLRRAGLARALVEEPDILLLDEPTNHLDLDAIEWMEGYLNSYRGTLMVISHDRTFLSNITNQVFWLDRGELRVSPKGFKHFEEWSEELLEQESRELKNRRQIVKQEVEWASRGAQARRTKSVNRIARMRELRDQLKKDEASYRRATQKIKLGTMKRPEHTAKDVAEFYNVHKAFEREDGSDLSILDSFSLRIQRGERIGILGSNGSGKTTFLKLLIGEEKPDKGSVKVQKDIQFSYFDQKRADLNPEETLMRSLAPHGGEFIDVMGKNRHVRGYLRDFMFDPARALDKVRELSGGQKNRLMLARVLANPKSCLILDEPTNDLDMDTLDMLEEILSNYKGTLIVVSHDRDFLDQTVTRILAFEGEGKITSLIGGYSDYLAFKTKQPNTKAKEKSAPAPKKKESAEIKKEKSKTSTPKKISYKFQRELSQLPGKIEKLTNEIQEHQKQLSDQTFYERDPSAFHAVIKAHDEAKATLERYENRWLELMEMQEESVTRFFLDNNGASC